MANHPSTTRVYTDEVYDHIVVGAGLSGLFATQQLIALQQTTRRNILILEANDRIGGRVYSPQGHDWGATWLWPEDDKRLMKLVRSYNVNTFEGEDGTIVSISNRKKDEDDVDAEYKKKMTGSLPGQLRFIGGAGQIIDGLYKDVSDHVEIRFHEKVISLAEQYGHDSSSVTHSHVHALTKMVQITTKHVQNGGRMSYMAKSVIIAVPPRLILRDVDFSPPLPEEQQHVMKSTPIWMEKASKAYITFPKRLWNADQLPIFTNNGCAIFDVSLDDIHKEGEVRSISPSDPATLCIFNLGIPFEFTEESLAERVYPWIDQALGDGITMTQEVKEIKIHNWASSPWTSVSEQYNQHDGPSARQAHRFGHPSLRRQAFGGSVSFASTETEPAYGHMEGALQSGERSAAESVAYIVTLND